MNQVDVPIDCGGNRGRLALCAGKFIVTRQDQISITAVNFEILCGKGKARNWKKSFRVVNEDGTTGVLVSKWLEANGHPAVTKKALQPDPAAARHPIQTPAAQQYQPPPPTQPQTKTSKKLDLWTDEVIAHVINLAKANNTVNFLGMVIKGA